MHKSIIKGRGSLKVCCYFLKTKRWIVSWPRLIWLDTNICLLHWQESTNHYYSNIAIRELSCYLRNLHGPDGITRLSQFRGPLERERDENFSWEKDKSHNDGTVIEFVAAFNDLVLIIMATANLFSLSTSDVFKRIKILSFRTFWPFMASQVFLEALYHMHYKTIRASRLDVWQVKIF